MLRIAPIGQVLSHLPATPAESSLRSGLVWSKSSPKTSESDSLMAPDWNQ